MVQDFTVTSTGAAVSCRYDSIAKLKLHLADSAGDVVGELGESFDGLLADDLDAASRAIDNKTGRSFCLATAQSRYYRVGVEGYIFIHDGDIANASPTIAFDVAGDGLYSTTLVAADYFLAPRNSVRFTLIRPGPRGGVSFLPGQWVKITTDWGFVESDGTPPAPIVKATRIQAARYFMRRHAIFGRQVIPETGIRETLPKLDPDVADIVSEYLHPALIMGSFA